MILLVAAATWLSRKLVDSIKTETAAIKSFHNVFRTLKKKLDNLHSKNGQVPDFALIVKNSIQHVIKHILLVP